MYVYFLSCSHGDTHWVKIGKTIHLPWMRIHGLQTGNPLRIDIVGVLKKTTEHRMTLAERRYQRVFQHGAKSRRFRIRYLGVVPKEAA